MKRIARWSVLPLLLTATVFLLYDISSHSAQAGTGTVVQLSINDAIGPATDDYIERALKGAEKTDAELVVIQMDTPGGLDSAMRGIIKNIANSEIPVATFVAPTGARAASAGTYILYASHIAAMAPGTNLGAATPVQIGGVFPPDPTKIDKDKPGEGDNKDTAPQNVQDASKSKAINDAVAYIRGLAKLHGRNAEWAEQAVRQAASLPADEALKLNVIDLVAKNMDDLLQKLDGRKVTINGETRILKTRGATVIQIDPDWRSRLLSVITNPNIAYILMLIGVYGLILEFYNPGAVLPGTIGAISLFLALYAFQLLPINYAGMALIFLGVALMVAEAFEPSFGMLGIGGVIAFVMGSIILIDTDAPGYGIDISIILTFAIASFVILFTVVSLALKARHRPVVSGIEELIGGQARVVGDFDRQGTVVIHGEHWRAVSETPLHKDQMVKVKEIDNLTLTVEPLEVSTEEDKT